MLIRSISHRIRFHFWIIQPYSFKKMNDYFDYFHFPNSNIYYLIIRFPVISFFTAPAVLCLRTSFAKISYFHNQEFIIELIESVESVWNANFMRAFAFNLINFSRKKVVASSLGGSGKKRIFPRRLGSSFPGKTSYP